jgi:Ca-activated chloride channel family protein
MFTDNDRRPLGLIIVLVAFFGFAAIVAASLFFAGTFCGVGIGLSCGAQTAASTEKAPTGSVEISFYSSNTKEDWINAVTEKFNAAEIKIAAGKPVFVHVTHVTSGGSQQDILAGKIKPVAWSPGDQSWVDGANQVWRDRTGHVLVTGTCKPTVYAPIGFGMWRPMAEALGWPDKPISWDTIIQLAADPQGWASAGHPEWGAFKFGHTHPDYSNAGLLIMSALAYSTIGETRGLTPEQVKSSAVIEAMRTVEQNTFHYGVQSRDLVAIMVRRGPSYLHAINTSEAEVLKSNRENAAELRFPLAFVFPSKGTFWTEQPFCVVNEDWVTPEQAEAARLYEAYLLAPEQQAMAVDGGLRPVDPSIQLHSPVSLDGGTDPRVTTASVPSLESPSADAAGAVKDVFHQTKKKATVVIVLDTSGSMEGDKIKNAVEATATFLQTLARDDEIFVLAFDDQPVLIQPAGRAGDVAEELGRAVRGLFAQGGTALYDSVCAAASQVNDLRTAHEAAGENRLYGIVVLSDGKDTASSKTENDMFGCLPSGEDVQGVKVFTIAYGGDADKDLLTRVANRTNGKTFAGDPDTIQRVYTAISAEQ